MSTSLLVSSNDASKGTGIRRRIIPSLESPKLGISLALNTSVAYGVNSIPSDPFTSL